MIRLPLLIPCPSLGNPLSLSPAPLDTTRMCMLIFSLTNKERVRRNFAPLGRYSQLDRIARFHSANMAANRFFAHDDPQGRDPQGRMTFLCPRLLGIAGENLALLPHGTEGWLARSAVTGWMNSPGHRSNILSPDFTHLGVGFAASEGGVYLTQSFAALSIEIVPQAVSRTRHGQKCVFPFIFLASCPRSDLALHLETPNPHAMFSLGNGKCFRGARPLSITWRSQDGGETGFTASQGRGAYRIFAGRKASGLFAPIPFVIEVS